MAENEDELCSPTSTDSFEIDSFQEEFVQIHNEYRRQHDAPDLTLNKELCQQAQRWAEKLAVRQHMAYCELTGIGENITFFPASMSPREIVDYWYNEHRKYEYETPGWQNGTNYFTQIIWRSTKEIGVGRKIVTSSDCQNASILKYAKSLQHNGSGFEDKQIVVAFYRPAGNNNRAGQFASNVLKPADDQ